MVNDKVIFMATKARRAGALCALLDTSVKNKALLAMASAINRHSKTILKANRIDIKNAKSSGLSSSLLKRLELNDVKLGQMSQAIKVVAELPDPVGRVLLKKKRPNGLRIEKVSVPIGVILAIYESRPNVTVDCMALCLKSGNAVILKGGRESLESNKAIFKILSKAAKDAGVPEGAFQLVADSGRQTVKTLLHLDALIDLVIPRGGEGLIREIARLSKIPVIKHYKGVCHVFVDERADLKQAEKIVINAKVQNPAVCNAMETLLVHQAVAKRLLPSLCRVLKEKGVRLRGCTETRAIVPWVSKASEDDWAAEYLDLILAVRVVKSLEEAVWHIEKYGSHHTDAIVTQNKKAADFFTAAVDSACVFVNCSTRFSDGGQFGMGAEIGISTDKLHARGPMGLFELTSYKYVAVGDGQVRE